MELIDIVDENGNFTGEVMDKDEVHDKNLLHNEVATFIINDKQQVLLQKRSANKRFNPNKWALCAGHVDAGEKLEIAALREIKEEVGISISIEDLKPFSEREFTLADSNSHITYFYYVKLNLPDESFTIQKEEIGITFTTRGYGHGVGMSQYGANGMANNGSTYEQILKHYYQGVKLSKM